MRFREVSNKETNIDSAKDALKMTEDEIKALFSLRNLDFLMIFQFFSRIFCSKSLLEDDFQELREVIARSDRDAAAATEERKKEHEELLGGLRKEAFRCS